jgi:hypothetical protein
MVAVTAEPPGAVNVAVCAAGKKPVPVSVTVRAVVPVGKSAGVTAVMTGGAPVMVKLTGAETAAPSTTATAAVPTLASKVAGAVKLSEVAVTFVTARLCAAPPAGVQLTAETAVLPTTKFVPVTVIACPFVPKDALAGLSWVMAGVTIWKVVLALLGL